jgi:hypothetical protein
MSMLFHHNHAVDQRGTVYQVPPKGAPNTVQAPEMSVSGILPALLFVAGCIAVLFGRRRRGAQ